MVKSHSLRPREVTLQRLSKCSWRQVCTRDILGESTRGPSLPISSRVVGWWSLIYWTSRRCLNNGYLRWDWYCNGTQTETDSVSLHSSWPVRAMFLCISSSLLLQSSCINHIWGVWTQNHTIPLFDNFTFTIPLYRPTVGPPAIIYYKCRLTQFIKL